MGICTRLQKVSGKGLQSYVRSRILKQASKQASKQAGRQASVAVLRPFYKINTLTDIGFGFAGSLYL